MCPNKDNIENKVEWQDNVHMIDLVIEHYKKMWTNEPQVYLWDKGPIQKLNYEFRVLEFPPNEQRDMWTYATVGFCNISDLQKLELHLFSSKKDESIIEILFALAYFNQNTNKVNVNDTVNFGRSWQDHSLCDHGLISLPYLDGPNLELMTKDDLEVRFYWLIPVTKNEVDFKIQKGIDKLEETFDKAGFNYLNPLRESVV